ncbi:GcrA family cell cycle regulator [Methylocella sp. CPCC 101449]|uniref:GcrA family cell cycle regulator n=1 Tax=Methylocella sp. CPCC 101449 TaxID=2987531 RepID=UPI00390886A1
MSAPISARWRAEDDAVLCSLWAEHVPTADIALRLGCSRNAVIGRANRLALPARRALNRISAAPGPNENVQTRPRIPIVIVKPRRVDDVVVAPPVTEAKAATTRWADMTPGQCRNIIGEEEDVFDRLVCGNVAEQGSSYCPACRSRMWCTPDQVLARLKRTSAYRRGGAA